jgi:hypothetical protein
MLEEFYVGRGDRRFGPFSVARLRGLAAAGRLQDGDTVWKEGMEKPVLAVKVKNLFPADPPPAHPAATGTPVAEEVAPSPEAAPPEALDPPAAEEPTTGAGAGREAAEAAAYLPGPPPREPAEDAAPPPARAEASPAAPLLEPVRKRRAIGLKGAVILSQDGVRVQYRKKCSDCGNEDTCRSSMAINNGVTRTHFFCTRCRKNRSVEIHGTIQ